MGASCQCEGKAEKIVIQALPIAVASGCSSVSMAEKDSKGMLNHRLLVASRDNDLPALQQALEQGAYVETRRPFVMRPKPPTSVGSLLEASGKKKKAPREGLTPLMYVVQNGSIAGAQLLLQARAQVMAHDEDRLTPLHFAASSGVQEVCSMLLNHGADKGALDDDGRKAADYVPRECTATRADRERWEVLLGSRTEPDVP
eukprot:CAMPEP_0115257476 /NCGR_PEP_ID=MMETSP0270-20121206/46792_1 /TAXON_ID=71861 /ORGANISM="Scrippsiella trochoidea, Strain CCMP3099" /LENGTH=200 /DNA_ID=CAMNT_0002673183 /DNA_START=79 /DNA_END=677 /DNA_ORIENTATION=+